MDEIENNYIPLDLLESVFSKQIWRPQSSGIGIKEEYVNDLEEIYNHIKLLPNIHINFDMIGEYLENYSGENIENLQMLEVIRQKWKN